MVAELKTSFLISSTEGGCSWGRVEGEVDASVMGESGDEVEPGGDKMKVNGEMLVVVIR